MNRIEGIRKRIERGLSELFTPETREGRIFVTTTRLNELLAAPRPDGRPFLNIWVQIRQAGVFDVNVTMASWLYAQRFEFVGIDISTTGAKARVMTHAPLAAPFMGKAAAVVIRSLVEALLGERLRAALGPEDCVVRGQTVDIDLRKRTLGRFYREVLAEVSGQEIPILGVKKLPEVWQIQSIEVASDGFWIEGGRCWNAPAFLPALPEPH